MSNKTYKQFLSDIGAEMRDAYEERKEQLDEVNKSDFSEKLKKQKREEINSVFDSKMKEFEARPGYEEALKSARYEGSMKHKYK